LADAGIAVGEFATGFKAGFLPEAGKVQDTERTGETGAD
jgi:hypothetical protein